MPALEYWRVSDLYDAYCRFDADVPYFIRALADAGGEVLELMAGTGRVSLPLLRAGVRLTCVDSDAAMLSILARKAPRVICGDVRSLPLRARYRAVILPFQGLSELAEARDRAALFAEVARVLERGGTFLCTTHNPAVRLRSLDGQWHDAGAFRDDDGRVVEVRVRGTFDAGSRVVRGEQRVTVRDARGAIRRDHLLPLRFALPPLEEIRVLAERNGFTFAGLHGNYDGAPFDAETSPVIVAALTSRA